jgi:ADP-ribose pyrophosphatase YjhB (NUDIX family)
MTAPTLTARLIASVILIKDGKALILNEPDDDGRMRKNLPGGHVEPRESVVDAAKREALEETGFQIQVGPLIQIISSSKKDGTHTIRQTFSARIDAGELRTEQDATAIWMTKEDVERIPEDALVFGVKEALLLAFEAHIIDPQNVVMRHNGKRMQFPEEETNKRA